MSPEINSASASWILVVEDDVDMAQLVSERLIHEGYKVLQCGKVTEAIVKIKNQAFACIILDLKLEQGTGQQVLTFARQDKHGFNYSTPVIVTSGFIDANVLQKIRAQIQGVLVKPFDLDALVSMIKNLTAPKAL